MRHGIRYAKNAEIDYLLSLRSFRDNIVKNKKAGRK
jgi:hypothetical protein